MQILMVKPKDWTMGRVILEVEYRCPRGSPGYVAFDSQNAIAALKSGIDALADVGIVPTDSAKWLEWGRFTLVTTQAGTADRKPGVTVIVRRA